jgi:hypothetical protein
MACPSSPDPSSYSLSDILPPSTILARVPLARLFAVNLQHKMLVRVFHYGKAKKSGWNSFIFKNPIFEHRMTPLMIVFVDKIVILLVIYS